MYRRNENHNSDFGQAYRKAADYCVIQDRCSSEIELKLNYWNIDKSFTEEILKKLVAEGFLDERRFAVNYASGKFRIKGWGKLKIAAGLRARSIPSPYIKEALYTIDSAEYLLFLQSLLTKKIKQLGSKTPANLQKAIFFATSRGFEPGLITSLLRNNELPDL
jgi:regulatory protein